MQVIVGFVAEKIATAMKTAGHVDAAQALPSVTAQANNSQRKAANALRVIELVAPVSGELVALELVPDEAFASGAVGGGVAILPASNIVVSPAAGTLVKIFNTDHAFCLETEDGAEIVVHMGIDTVALAGQGFTRLAEEGATVVAGQPILEMDLVYLEANVRSMVSPVVCSNIEAFAQLEIKAQGQVKAGEPLYHIKG